MVVQFFDGGENFSSSFLANFPLIANDVRNGTWRNSCQSGNISSSSQSVPLSEARKIVDNLFNWHYLTTNSTRVVEIPLGKKREQVLTIKNKTFFLILTFSLTSTFLPNSAKAATPKVLTIWTEQASVSAVKSLSANWATEQGITVEVVGKNGFGMADNLATIGPAGKGPDIIILQHDSIAGLAITGAISPLSSSIFDPKSVAKSAVTAVSFNSQIYAVPLTVQNLALATNLSLAKSAPSTFSEMEEKSRDLIAAGKAKVGLVTDANGYGVYPIFDALGGYVFKTSGSGKIDPKVTGIYSSELAKNTAVFERFKREKFMDFSKLWGNTAFFDGKAPYMLVGAWNVPALNTSPFKYEISGIPNLQGRPARVLTGVQAAAMSNFAKSKLVARDYLKNVVSKSNFSSALAKAQNSFPVNLVAAAAQDPNSIGTKFGNVGLSGFPMPNIPQMQKVWAYWNGAWENWGNDKGSFSEIFSKAAKDLTLALNS